MSTHKPPDEKNQTPAAAAPEATPAPAAPPPAPAPAAPPAPAATAKPAAQAPQPQASSARAPRTLSQIAEEPREDKVKKDGLRVARKVLRSFGIDVKKGDDIEAKAEEFKREQSEKKDKARDLRTKAETADKAEKAAKDLLDTELGTLDDSTRAQVKLFLGDGNAVDQLAKFVDVKRAGLVKSAAPAPAAAPAPSSESKPAEKPAAAPAPASTAPTAQAPSASSPTQAPDLKTEIGRLRNAGESGDKRSALIASVALFENKGKLFKDDHRPKPE